MIEVDLQSISIVLTGIGLIIALTYYGLQIRNQNKQRQAQMYMNIWNQSHMNKEWADAFTHFNSIEINSYDDFLSKFDWGNPETLENAEARRTLTFFFEGLGVFVKEGYIGIRPIALLMTRLTRIWWEKIETYVKIHRDKGDYPRYLSEAEYLYDELMKYIEEHPELKT